MAWNTGRPFIAVATGAIGPARGGFIKTVVLTAPVNGSALMSMLDGAGGTVIGPVRAPLGQSIVFEPGVYYIGQGTITLSAGTASLYLARGGGTAL